MTLGQTWMCNIMHNGHIVPMILKHVETNEFGQVWQDENGMAYAVVNKLYPVEV
ncbi:hypothetical protein BBMUFFIN_206 [Vibrio phage BBMuffin]|nr:hypothetical protein BBMUFFIN_206 [Vibrio phage BBMuffin]